MSSPLSLQPGFHHRLCTKLKRYFRNAEATQLWLWYVSGRKQKSCFLLSRLRHSKKHGGGCCKFWQVYFHRSHCTCCHYCSSKATWAGQGSDAGSPFIRREAPTYEGIQGGDSLQFYRKTVDPELQTHLNLILLWLFKCLIKIPQPPPPSKQNHHALEKVMSPVNAKCCTVLQNMPFSKLPKMPPHASVKTFFVIYWTLFFNMLPLGVFSVHSFNLLNFKVNRKAPSGGRKPGGLKKKLKRWSLPPDAFGTSCTTSMSCITVGLSILLLALSSLNSLSLGFSFFVVKVEMSCSRAGLGNPVLYPLHSLFTLDSFKLKLWSHFPHRFSATLFFLKPLCLAHGRSEFLFFLFFYSPTLTLLLSLPPDMSPPFSLCSLAHSLYLQGDSSIAGPDMVLFSAKNLQPPPLRSFSEERAVHLLKVEKIKKTEWIWDWIRGTQKGELVD